MPYLLRRGGNRSICQGYREQAYDIQGMLALVGVTMAAKIMAEQAYFGVHDHNLSASWLIEVRGPMEQDIHQLMHVTHIPRRISLADCNSLIPTPCLKIMTIE
jgi:hypothetical protein